MVVSSVLVAGAGLAGDASAITLARRGWEVTLVECAPQWQDAATGVALPGNVSAMLREAGVAADAPDVNALLSRRLRELAVEQRPGTRLVGAIAVDRHVEAKLSDGRIENYDVIVVVEGTDVRLTASSAVSQSDAVDAIARALAPE